MTKIVTHNGHYHTDDLLAVASLLLLYPNAEVVRSRDERVIESADVVVDVGLLYDPAKCRFDHHQPSGAGKRHNDVPYASFGLVWKEFGEKITGGKEEAKIIDEKLVSPVDALDNGVKISTPVFDNIVHYTIGDYFHSFSDEAETLEDFDNIFKTILPLAVDLLKREIGAAKRSVKDWKEVENIYNLSENKKIIVLPLDMHWKRVLIPRETVFVVNPRHDGKWRARAVPKAINSFEIKKPFPMSWAGLSNETLAGVSGVADAVACHRDLWTAVARSKEGAMKLAETALNA